MRPKAEWAIDSEPIRAPGINVKYTGVLLIESFRFEDENEYKNEI